MAQLFISYSKQNIEFATYLFGLLQKAGFSLWMDAEELVASERWWPTIEQNIKSCNAFVIIMSPQSLTSDWVEREILVAEKWKKPIFPVLFDGEGWSRLANIQYYDMRAGLNAILSPRLVEALRRTVNEETPAPKIETAGTHLPVSTATQTDSRKLEAAMPAETKAGSDTEVRAKISLPASEGLRAELPAVVQSGDVIQKEDAHFSTFPLHFPLDERTGQRLSIKAVLRLSSGDFSIAASDKEVEVEIPPDSDSRTVVFMLEANPNGKTSGRSRVKIDLIYQEKIIAEISVSTVLVERVTAAVPTWTLAAVGYAAPGTGENAPGAAVSSETSRSVPSAQPSLSALPDTSSQLRDEPERGSYSAREKSADADDEPLPTYDDDAKKIAPLDDNVPQPAAPQSSSSATRSPASGTIDITRTLPDRSALRRRSTLPVLLIALLALVGVVILAISASSNAATSATETQVALGGTMTSAAATETQVAQGTMTSAVTTAEGATQQAATSIAVNSLTQQAVATLSESHSEMTATAVQAATLTATAVSTPLRAIAVAPFVNCPGTPTPDSDLVNLLSLNGVAVVPLTTAIETQADARAIPGFRVVVWGICNGDTLALNLELLQTVSPEGIIDPMSVSITTPSNLLGETTASAPILVRALANYAKGQTDYAALAKTFDILAAGASDAAQQSLLYLLEGNSLLYSIPVNVPPSMQSYDQVSAVYKLASLDSTIKSFADNNRSVALINHAYAINNPRNANYIKYATEAVNTLSTLIDQSSDWLKAIALGNRGAAYYLLYDLSFNQPYYQKASADCKNAAQLNAQSYVCQAATIYYALFYLQATVPMTGCGPYTSSYNDALKLIRQAVETDKNYPYSYYYYGALLRLHSHCDGLTGQDLTIEHTDIQTEFTQFLQLLNQRPIHLFVDQPLIQQAGLPN